MAQIPQPSGVPILGNIGDVDTANISKSLFRLAETYGDIYRLNLLGRSTVVANTQELCNELCDEKRFLKRPSGALEEVRNGVGDGLFSAFEDEENWGIAHRVLMPSFGPFAIRGMFDEMHEIAAQMASRLARQGGSVAVDPTDQFTRLALDSIALCSMDTRFNSFYRDSMHPFIEAMGFFLGESGQRALRPKFVSDYVYRASTRKYWESIELMKNTARQAIEERRAHPSAKKDLLNAMLEGKDPKSGKHMSDDSIIKNAITFLIAGHETTAGTLSFLFVALTKNPAILKAAQKEVDEVIGNGPVTVEHMGKLPYITACIRETLRLNSPISAWIVRARPSEGDGDIFLGEEKYIISQADALVVNLQKVHRDPKVYGEDAEEFKPERMLDEPFNKLPPNSWKPFGNGARACIGRAFAWQEMHLVIAMLLQNFNFRAQDPAYVLDVKSTLTVKPKDFYLYATLREGVDPPAMERRLWGGKEARQPDAKDKRVEAASKVDKKPMSIYYGSNTGTCDALAQSLANTASSRGYDPRVEPLDAAAENLPTDRPVAIITASYEGEPPDNAFHFIEWIRSLKGNPLKDVNYAVFGCGNRDWATTFQKIPTVTDNLLSELGGSKICERGVSDVADNHIFDDFDHWTDNTFWPGVTSQFGDQGESAQSFGLDVSIEPSTRATDLAYDVKEGIILENKVLTAPGEPEKRHVEIQLPTGSTYVAGDYLAVLPLNHNKTVKAVMARFNIPWDASIQISPSQHTFLPSSKPLPVYSLLSMYVELHLPCTHKNLQILAHHIPDATQRASLLSLTPTTIAEQHLSVLNLLETYPSCALPFGDYLAMLSPLRVRQYSISSSPLVNPTTCTLTYGVLDLPATHAPGKRHLGTASNYLSELQVNDRILVAVRPSSAGFHLPLDVTAVPVIMVCAGSGLAPFHGFVAERAAQIEAGRTLAPAMLFVGCRHPERDALYSSELAELMEKGVVDVRYAFSQAPERSGGAKYVQERMWNDRAEAERLWDQGARIYVCGNGKVAEGVRDVVIRTALEGAKRKGKETTREAAEKWWEGVRGERFASDVFA